MNQSVNLVVFPLQAELHEFLKYLSKFSKLEETKFPNFKTHFAPDLNTHFARCGHGKVQAAIQTQQILYQLGGIEHVFCLGAAGGIGKNLKIGDVVVSEKTIEHDFIEKFKPQALPTFATDSATREKLTLYAPTTFAIHFGAIASGDEDITDEKRANEIALNTSALAVAWEGAGVARTARLNKISFTEIRAISDLANGSASTDFAQNLGPAMQNLSSTMLHIF